MEGTARTIVTPAEQARGAAPVPQPAGGSSPYGRAGEFLTTERTAALIVLGCLAYLVVVRHVFQGAVV